MTATTAPRWTVPHETEGFTYVHLRWDVAKAWTLVADVAPDSHITVAEWAPALFGAPSPEAMLDPSRIYVGVGVDTAWCLTNDVDLTRPVLVVTRTLPNGGATVTLMIDGYHRLYRAWHDGVETLPAIMLTPEQERQARL